MLYALKSASSIPATTEGALHGVSVIGFKGGQAGVEELALRDDDHVEALSYLVSTKNLSNQTFSFISLDRSAQFFCRRDAETADCQAIGKDEDGAVPSVHACALLVNLLELCAGLDPFIGPERSQCLPGADRQALAALCAPPLEHQPAVFRAHAHQKSVGFPATPGVGLERPLPLHIPSLGNEPSMLAFTFGRCQCRAVCVTVPSLHESKSPRQSPCTFGLSPEFSTPVEKTVEIRGIR